MANRSEAERKEVPLGPLDLMPSSMGALPGMISLSTSKGVTRKRVDTVMGLMVLPTVVNSKQNPLWDMCAGEHNVPAPSQRNRGTPVIGAIPWHTDFLTSERCMRGCESSTT